MKFLLRDRRQDSSLEADHRADESVYYDEERKLRKVRSETEVNCGEALRGVVPTGSLTGTLNHAICTSYGLTAMSPRSLRLYAQRPGCGL